jgi:hypothetical protein
MLLALKVLKVLKVNLVVLRALKVQHIYQVVLVHKVLKELKAQLMPPVYLLIFQEMMVNTHSLYLQMLMVYLPLGLKLNIYL